MGARFSYQPLQKSRRPGMLTALLVAVSLLLVLPLAQAAQHEDGGAPLPVPPGSTLRATLDGKTAEATVACTGSLKPSWPKYITRDGPCFSYHMAHRGLILFGEARKHEDSISYQVKTDCKRLKVVGHVKGQIAQVEKAALTASKELIDGKEKDRRKNELNQL